jgi:ATP-dependent protease ClpP protease subunit
LIATRQDACGHLRENHEEAVEQILKDIATTQMTAEDARDYGLVDRIFSKEMRTGQSALT